MKILPLEIAGVNASFELRVDYDSMRANVSID